MATAKKPLRTVAGRIEWILQTRDITHEQLAQYCGFKHRTEVSAYLYRLRKDQDYYKRMSFDTLEKLAKGCRVSLMWLVEGKETPDVSDTPVVTKFENLQKALKLENNRWQKQTISFVGNLPWERDLSPLEWIAVLDNSERSLIEIELRLQSLTNRK